MRSTDGVSKRNRLGGRPRRPDPAREASATVAPFRAWRGLQRVATGKPAQAAMELVALMMGVGDASFKQRKFARSHCGTPHPWCHAQPALPCAGARQLRCLAPAILSNQPLNRGFEPAFFSSNCQKIRGPKGPRIFWQLAERAGLFAPIPGGSPLRGPAFGGPSLLQANLSNPD